jgi:hypothetical protein
MAEEKLTLYAQAVKKSHWHVSQYEKFRKTYPDEFLHVLCQTCVFCKGRELTLDDIMTTKNTFCRYQIEKKITGINPTKISPCVFGKYLAELKDVNRYVMVALSTPFPHLPIDKDKQPNQMFITFCMPKNESNELCQMIKQLYPDYLYLVVCLKKQMIINCRITGQDDSDSVVDIVAEMVCKKTYESEVSKQEWFKPFRKLLDDDLVEVTIEDPNHERRDLYHNVSNLLNLIMG